MLLGWAPWRGDTVVGEEGPSNSVSPNGQGSVNGSKEKAPRGPLAHYEVGPGFEIAIRAAPGKPVEVTLKGEQDGAPPPKGRGGTNHRHDSVEKRLDAIERSILLLADHMQRVDERLSAGGRVAPQQKP